MLFRINSSSTGRYPLSLNIALLLELTQWSGVWFWDLLVHTSFVSVVSCRIVASTFKRPALRAKLDTVLCREIGRAVCRLQHDWRVVGWWEKLLLFWDQMVSLNDLLRDFENKSFDPDHSLLKVLRMMIMSSKHLLHWLCTNARALVVHRTSYTRAHTHPLLPAS